MGAAAAAGSHPGLAADCQPCHRHHHHSFAQMIRMIYESSLLQLPPWLLLPSFQPPLSPLLACRMAEGGGHLHPSLVLLVCSPPPILLSFYSHSSQLSSPVHQKFSSKVGNVDPLRHLPVQCPGCHCGRPSLSLKTSHLLRCDDGLHAV